MAAKKPLAPGTFLLPLAYRVFFLGIEPLAALVGAIYAHFRQADYLRMTHAPSFPVNGEIPLGTSVVMSQLANLYLLFTLNEALVLRSTGDLKVWRRVLIVLLIADLGHLYSLKMLGGSVYWNVLGWNAIDWGNVPFVYAGASMRMAFLCGVGFGGGVSATGKKKA